jgi:hypothetical protein
VIRREPYVELEGDVVAGIATELTLCIQGTEIRTAATCKTNETTFKCGPPTAGGQASARQATTRTGPQPLTRRVDAAPPPSLVPAPEHDADDDADWWRLARHVVELALGTAMRRGEIIGLRWRDVEPLDRRLHVRETIVRGNVVTPKSPTSRRTMETCVESGRDHEAVPALA